MDERQIARLVAALRHDRVQVRASDDGARVYLDLADRGTIVVPSPALDAAVESRLVRLEGDAVSATPAGKTWLARWMGTADHARQHQERVVREMEIDGETVAATVNLNESPLSSLAQRRGRDGQAFLTPGEVEAGERLRADYDFGQIVPRIGANWEAAVSGGRRGGAGGRAELTDDALAARQRVDRAIDAVGPELSGVLVDVCCFLKGLEQVEMERSWPRRSAKLMLKTALGALDRHYRPPTAPRRMRHHWGADDYRPRID